MKQFFKFVLASIVGFALTLFLGFIIFAAMIASIASSFNEKETSVKENSILELNLGLDIADRTVEDPFMYFLNEETGGETVGLDRITKVLKEAKNSEKIKGVFINTSYVGAGFATLEEIRNALLDFKESGKLIYAYSEFYSEPSYYLASVADSIYLNPSGTFLFNGLSSQTAFLTDAMKNLGVEMQVIKVGKFKGATETFTEKQLSGNNRHQTQVFINTIYGNYLKNLSLSRNISVDTLQSIADNLSINLPQDAVRLKLIDRLAFVDEVKSSMKIKLGIKEDKKINFISINKTFSSSIVKKKYKKEKIAVIYASGEIRSGKGDERNIGSQTLTQALRDARLDNNIKAIVLRVNSPGGSALASDVIYREAELCAQVKPFIVSMGNLAASGGYFISSAADTIVAQPTTITGSIGVFMSLPNMQKLLNDKIGVTYESVNSAKKADIGRIDRALSADERQYFQNMVDKIYDDFLTRVSDGRGLSKERVDSIGQGRVWTAIDAQKIGLVDVIGGLDKAIEIAAFKAGIEEYGIKSLPKVLSPIEKLSKSLNGMETSFIKSRLGSNYGFFQTMERLNKLEGIQMLLPCEIKID